MPHSTPSALSLDQLLAHGDFVRALARSLLDDRHRAEDVVQDTLVAAIEHPPRESAGLRSWMATVARNFARQSARHDDRAHAREQGAARHEAVPSTAEVVEREAVRREVVEAVLALHEPYRSVLLQRFYEDLPPREIARRRSVPVETVRTHLKRGLERLRERLDETRRGERAAWPALLALLATTDHRSAPRAPWYVGAAAATLVGGSLAALSLIRGPLASNGATVPAPTVDAPVLGASPPPRLEAAEAIEREAASSEPVSVAAAAATPPAQPQGPKTYRYTIEVPEREVSGRVVDERDRPIAGALVYAGDQIEARGDEPFKPFQEQRIKDGVRTDAAGQFVLRDRERHVTAWHPDRGAVTVPWEKASLIAIPAKAPLRGRLVDGAGKPLPGRALLLDRDQGESVTAEDGSFEFPLAEIGVRGLRLDRKGPFFGIRHAAGPKQPHVLVWDEARTTVDLTAGGAPFLEKIEGAFLGLDETTALRSFEAKDGRGTVPGLTPGAYLLLLAGCRAIRVDVPPASGPLSVELGAGTLLVKGPKATRIFLVPQGSDDFTHLLAGRVSCRPIPEDGALRLEHLPEGKYEIGIDCQWLQGGILGPVEVTASGANVVLE